MANNDIKKTTSQIEIGWRRLSSIYIDYSLVLLPAFYISAFILKLLEPKTLIFNNIDQFLGSIVHTQTFDIVVLVCLLGYILITVNHTFTTLGKKICGLIITTNNSESSISQNQLLKRELSKFLSLLVIQKYVAPVVVVMIWYIGITILLKVLGDNHPLITSLFSFQARSSSVFTTSFSMSIIITYFIIHYFIFISLSKKRGVHDIFAKTKVISAPKYAPNTQSILLLVTVITCCYLLIIPLFSLFQSF